MTAALASAVPAPPLVRLRPVPAMEPPYEDDPARWPGEQSRVGPADVELPLDWARPRTGGHRTGGRSRARRTGQGDRERTGARSGQAGWRVVAADLPLAIKRFVDMYVEVLNDRRPLRHLLRYATDAVFHEIRSGLARRGRAWWPMGRRPTTGRRPYPASRTRPAQVRVRRVRSCQPRPGVVEVVAVLQRGDETRAVALRLEQEHSRWICTALEFVG